MSRRRIPAPDNPEAGLIPPEYVHRKEQTRSRTAPPHQTRRNNLQNMKTKKGFNLRNVCGENIIVAEGEQNIDFSNIISMNEASAYLWQKVLDRDSFTIADMVRLLLEEYEVDEQTAQKDAQTLAAQWGKVGIIEGDDIPEDKGIVTYTELKDDCPEQEKKEKKGLFKKLFR